MYTNRLKELRKRLNESEIDGILLTSPFNRKYMTGFTGSAGYVIVTNNQAALITDGRYTTQAAQQVEQYDVIIHGPKFMDAIKETIATWKVKKLGFEQNNVTHGAFLSYQAELDGVELVPTENVVEHIRVRKDEAELAIIREAVQLADLTFTYIIGKIRAGLSERDVAAEIEYFMRKHGASSASFETIVASGVRSALPHGLASDRILQKGDFVTLDFGALYKGYCSDITRTVVLGSPTAKQQEIYNVVREANERALLRIKAGTAGKEADEIARKVIERHGYGENFSHSLGHGIGLEIHEAPTLSKTSETVLESGMVVTVEPGIYVPDLGGVRIEDDVLITDEGVEVLTKSTKELIVID